jgi:hypothetical protein
MPLKSKLMKGDPALEACLVSHAAHILRGASGNHVGKIQTALAKVDRAAIDAGEVAARVFGLSTESAVLAYKTRRKIVNHSYQTAPDAVVGKMTVEKLDAEYFSWENAGPPVIAPPAKNEPPSAGIKQVKIWFNAFIDASVKKADGSALSFKLTRGPHSGATAIPGPFTRQGPYLSYDDCYLTDQRSFDASVPTASSRIHAEATIDFTGAAPVLRQSAGHGATVATVRVRQSTGDVLNSKTGVAKGTFKEVSGFVPGSKSVKVDYEFAGANPAVRMPLGAPHPPPLWPMAALIIPTSLDPPPPLDPDIDMKGSFVIDVAGRTLTIDGFIDGFPSYEAYADADGKVTKIYQKPPVPGKTPASGLFGKANVPVKGTFAL